MQVPPSETLVWLGPAIGPNAFEEKLNRFKSTTADIARKSKALNEFTTNKKLSQRVQTHKNIWSSEMARLDDTM